MSKSFAMAGLRIGWLATRDRELLGRCARIKDYTTICSSAPSEILALIGLRARERVLGAIAPDRRRQPGPARRLLPPPVGRASRGSDRVAARSAFRDSWPTHPIDTFAKDLVEAEGVLLLPGSQFDHPGQPLPDRVRSRESARGAAPGSTRSSSARACRLRRRLVDDGRVDLLHPSTARELRRRR